MKNVVSNFKQFSDILYADRTFFQEDQVKTIPFKTATDDKFLAELTDNIKSAAASTTLPKVYQDGYFGPLCRNLRGIVETLTQRVVGVYDCGNYTFLTQMVNAVLQSSPESGVYRAAHSLQQFVDDLYKSFTTSFIEKVGRHPTDHKYSPLVSFTGYIPLEISNLPPMPGTLELYQLRDLVGNLADGFEAGVVGLPPGYRSRPLLWGVMGHEVMGHYVLTADHKDQWLTALENAVYQMIQREYPKEVDDQLAALWRFWTEEAAADVCSVLTFGPYAGIGALSFYTALMPLSNWSQDHELKAIYQGEDNAHPINALIPYLMCGAIDGLDKLSQRSRYIDELRDVGAAITKAKTVDGIEIVEFPLGSRVWDPLMEHQPVNLLRVLPFDLMKESAYKVGRFVVTNEFEKLGCPLGSLFSWHDRDQDAADEVAQLFPENLSVAALDKIGKWEKRHLIAGGLIAVIREPTLYHDVNKALLKCFAELN